MSRCLLQSTSITVHVICIPGRSHDSVAVFPTLISNTTVWWSDCSSYFILIYTKLSIQPLFVLIILGIWMVVRFSVENQYMKSVYLFRIDLKMDFRSKRLFLHIHLYFLATQYLWKYALVEDRDNWTRCYILIIMNWNRQNNINRVSLTICLVFVGNLKVGKPMLCCFSFRTQHRFLHLS